METYAAADRPALPRHIYFEPTNRCNLRCRGCIRYRGNWEAERDMSFKDLRMITAQLPGLERAVLHGIGEPLLNRALPDMIRHLKARRVRVCFNSNGTLLSAKRQADLLDAGPDELRVSLDAASPAGYRAMRGSDRFDGIVRNLKSFIALRKTRGAATPLLSLWYLGIRDNIAELPDFIRLSADIGIDEVHLQRLVYFQEGPGYGIARDGQSLQDDRKVQPNGFGKARI
jgi:MoaA/NifB/PqqE/SkfB family radical SAM enzyme